MKNQVQLICYADRLGAGGISGLADLLRGPLRSLFGGVHILPFFHPIDGADAGFDPIDHTQVDSRLGAWSDIKSLSVDVDVIADVIVNHMSCQSPQFLDYVCHGDDSKFNGLFLTKNAVFPKGPSPEDLRAIYRPRPGLPFTDLVLKNGQHRCLWTTFTENQIDIDVRHPHGVAYLDRILKSFSERGVRMIRLDAVGYCIKRPGTSCFMIPETFEFIAEFTAKARQLGMRALVEIHSYYRTQINIAAHADWVYDFALPPLLLHAFAFHTSKYLQRWIEIRPTNAFTVLDTHDGIGIVDVGPDPHDPVGNPGLVPAEELDRLVDIIHANNGDQSREATGASASNLDIYQVNCTFYDAMGRNDDHYLLARSVQFFLPGIPQVYYVGLLAGENDMALLRQTGVGRDINRHYYTRKEIEENIGRPVVAGLLELIRLRNTHPAFSGTFSLRMSEEEVLELYWTGCDDFASLRVDFKSGTGSLNVSSPAKRAAFPPVVE